MTKEKKLQQVANSLINDSLKKAKCVLIVNHRTKTYECLESDEFFNKIVAQQGSLEDLSRILFFHNKSNELDKAGEYEQFQDFSVFERDGYRVNLLFIDEEKEYEYELIQSRINEDEVAIMIFDQERFFNNSIEKEKMETIQESYLFSMIVDLANDCCINPNITEIRSDRQDFMDISYSDWRFMISKMFQERDKVLFLRASSPENVINTLESKVRFHIDLQMLNMQGQYAWSRLSFARMKNFSRENPRFLYTVTDISEDMNQLLRQEGITKAVEQQNEILQRLDQEKTRFFANMSHEFRVPINAIMGMNEVILRSSAEANIREYAEDIKSASKILLHLINDILDYSKIQAGKMEIFPVEYEMNEMIRNVSNMIRSMVQDREITYEVVVADDVPRRLFGDEIRITQILMNLLTNAVKYTDEGKVTLSVKCAKNAHGMDAIEYDVSDTGCGIKPEDMDKLFSAYGRIDLNRNRRVEGTGLGIGIVTGLLEAMNSSLQVESEYGKGSRFSFVLTQNYVNGSASCLQKNSTDTQKEIDLSEKKILVVDDNAINLKVADILLKKLGINADLVDSGEGALDRMEKQEYDVIFLDHMMPGMDGLETLKKARVISGHYQQAPFIALTGNVSPTARDEYICMGFTDYLEKPINPEKIKEILDTYVKYENHTHFKK